MRWKVEGADPVTGSDQLLSIEALTAEEAERQARYNGLLVSKVSPASPRRTDTPVLLYASPPARKEAPAGESAASDVPVAPEYPQIISGAKWLSRMALVLFALSALATLAAAGVFALGLRHVLQKRSPDDSSEYLAAGLWLVAGALGGCVAALLLRMLAALGLAVRDIARNSYRRHG